MKATKKLALVCAALAAATFGFVSCSSDDDSDYDDNAAIVALTRSPTTWKATGAVTTTKTVDALDGITTTQVTETDYSTGNKTETTTVVAKDGTTTTTVKSYDRSTGEYTEKVDGVTVVSGASSDSFKYTSYEHSDVIAFAFNGTYTQTRTEKYVTASKSSSASSYTGKGTFKGYPTLGNQTITLAATSFESSSSDDYTSSSSSTSYGSDTGASVTIGKVSSDRKTLTVTDTYTYTSTYTSGTTTSNNSTQTITTVTTYAKQ